MQRLVHVVKTSSKAIPMASLIINSLVPETKLAEFANSVDLDEVAHHEPPHLDLHCLRSGL